jgi:tetratricopeptide (TPR) repeat protein
MNPGGRLASRPGSGGGLNRPSFGNMSRPGGGGLGGNLGGVRHPGEMGRPNRPGGIAGGGGRPGQGGAGERFPGIGGGGMRPGKGGAGERFPGIAGGGSRPGQGGAGERFPGIGGGGTRPGQGGAGERWPGIAGGGSRPGQGGSGERWPGIAGGGSRPGQGGSGERWPGFAGGGSRPGQGGSGERWPGFAGGGSRPGQGGSGTQWPIFSGGGTRPGGGGSGERWPGIAGGGNRPFFNGGNASGSGINSGNSIGSGNIGQIGDNLGIVNRPNYGGNNFGGNTFQGGNNYNVNSYSSGYNSAPVVAGNVGGGWGGGYGGGWAAPYYGNWYRGSFGNAGSFWGGFGAGALTSFGLNALAGAGAWGYGASGAYAAPVYSTTIYNDFPTWGMSTYNDWGLGSVASDWLYSGYSNPYSATQVAEQPATTNAAYDYSQPINVTSAPADPAIADSTEQIFSAARDRFKAGDYERALDLADQVLKQTPNVAVVHEFRALALFALGRYEDAAAADYAALSAGPGWNWPTLIGLYGDADTYTRQLRALEAYARENPKSSSAPFLLGYHYMIEGHDDAAAAQFETVTQLSPADQLSASFVKALRRPPEQVAQSAAPTQEQAPAAGNVPAPTVGPAPAQTQVPAPVLTGGPAPGQTPSTPNPPRPPAALGGNWKAQPAPDLSVALNLKEDGTFVWDVDSKGRKQSLQGQASFQDGTLTLQQQQGPPLVGKVTQTKPDSFTFAPPGSGNRGGGLVFNR